MYRKEVYSCKVVDELKSMAPRRFPAKSVYWINFILYYSPHIHYIIYTTQNLSLLFF